MLQFITLKIRNKKENDNMNKISKTVVVLREKERESYTLINKKMGGEDNV